MSAPAVGQIWREVDPRHERYIRVESVGIEDASVRSVIFDGTIWVDAPKSRQAFASLKRFNGKRGGYDLHMEAP